MAKTQSPLGELLARHTREGALYEALPQGRVRCFACGHRCVIPPGFDGICRVRFNEGGRLLVPHGYVGGLQVDPIEKKPFFHALPGAKALSFGMLGCDYHCGYCFDGQTSVVTETGPRTFEELFESCERKEERHDATLGFPLGRLAVTAKGRLRPINGVARHRYMGEMAVLTPRDLAPLECTLDHRFLVTSHPDELPRLKRARDLSVGDSLVIPKGRWTLDAAPEMDAVRRGAIETADHHLVPIRAISRRPHDGYVYNMEVEEDHSYLAGLFAVSNCQNWVTSQALRDTKAVVPPQEMSPEELVRLAARHGARVMTSTYNEPLITSEWAMEVFRPARAAGLVCSYVSNGNATAEVLDYIRPLVSLYKVDLKSFRDRHYRELGGTLERVLWTLRALHEQGFWLEVVTLVIPGFNDTNEELIDIARFLVSISPDVPWHVTAFHQDYRMTDPDATPVATLLRACEIGRAAGLRYVYAGNLPGRVGRWENTECPHCGALLVERVGYRILQDRMETGACPECRRAIAGFWEPQAAALNATGDTRAVHCWPENETARR